MRKILDAFRWCLNWLWAADVPPMGPSGVMGTKPNIPRGRVVSAEVGLDMGHDADVTLTVESELGLSIFRNRKTCACGRYVYQPYATCGYCGSPICGKEHHFLCVRSGCGVGLCPHCVHWFRLPAGSDVPAVPLCPAHIEVARQTGLIDGGW